MRHPLASRLALLSTAAYCMVLLAPSAAGADRAPSSVERGAIVRASRAVAAPTQFVKASGVRISTAGPWATARVALYLRRAPSKPEMISDDLFVHTHGRWVDAAVDGKDREPPDRVLKDLGFDTRGGGLTTATVVIIVVVVVVLLLLAARGMSFTSDRGPLAPEQPPTNRPAPAPYEPFRMETRKVKQSCPHCGGSGREPQGGCGLCGGSGWRPNPNWTRGGPESLPCDCRNRKPCTGPCHGSGQIDVEVPI